MLDHLPRPWMVGVRRAEGHGGVGHHPLAGTVSPQIETAGMAGVKGDSEVILEPQIDPAVPVVLERGTRFRRKQEAQVLGRELEVGELGLAVPALLDVVMEYGEMKKTTFLTCLALRARR